jgi:DNA-binding Xre family transcriptional regulator
LGAQPDAELARRLGCGKDAVARRRKLLGVPAHLPQPTRLQGDGYVSLSPERLRLRRLWKRMSQRAVAERAGLSVPHYHNLERGVVKRARRETADRVAKALGCRVRDIVSRAT